MNSKIISFLAHVLSAVQKVIDKKDKKVKDPSIKEMESIKCNKVQEAAKTIKDPNKVIKKKDTSKDLKIEPSSHKVPVFKFGATARKTVSDQTNIQEEGKKYYNLIFF